MVEDVQEFRRFGELYRAETGWFSDEIARWSLPVDAFTSGQRSKNGSPRRVVLQARAMVRPSERRSRESREVSFPRDRNYHCGRCYATWHFRTPRLWRAPPIRPARVPIIGKATFFLSLSLFFFTQRGMSPCGSTRVKVRSSYAKTGSRGVGFSPIALEKQYSIG